MPATLQKLHYALKEYQKKIPTKILKKKIIHQILNDRIKTRRTCWHIAKFYLHRLLVSDILNMVHLRTWNWKIYKSDLANMWWTFLADNSHLSRLPYYVIRSNIATYRNKYSFQMHLDNIVASNWDKTI